MIADTHNSRIVVRTPDDEFLRSLGQTPLLRNPSGLATGPDGALFIADTERDVPLAYLGPGQPAQADGYIRLSRTDMGEEPTSWWGDSPDIIVRRRPDLDIEALGTDDLARIGSEPIVEGARTYIYVQINRKGSAPLPPGSVRLLGFARPLAEGEGTGSSDTYPGAWRTDGMAQVAPDGGPGTPGARLFVPEIVGDFQIAGPLSWTPEHDASGCSSRLLLMARYINPFDPTELSAAEGDSGSDQAFHSNNVSIKPFPFVEDGCLPDADRFESNNSADTAADVSGPWTFLGDRCPRRPAVAGQPYPEARCEGIFEDGVAPRFAEQIWTLDLGDLSLHSALDADFFRVPLPNLSNPAYSVSDIRPKHIRDIYGDSPGYEPEPMPECGAVQRIDPGPAGADRGVWVNVTTRLLIEAIPEGAPENTVAEHPVGTAGETLRHYGDTDATTGFDAGAFDGTGFRLAITCPQEVEGLSSVLLSFGERAEAMGFPVARGLDYTGGYRLRLRYVSEITRTTPAWAADPTITGEAGRGVRCVAAVRSPDPGPMPGGPGFSGIDFAAGFAFPFCLPDDFGRVVGVFIVPDLGCVADGPGCFQDIWFNWPGGDQHFFVALTGPEASVKLIRLDQEVIGSFLISRDVPPLQMPGFTADLISAVFNGSGQDRAAGIMVPGILKPGNYALRIEGAVGLFGVSMPTTLP